MPLSQDRISKVEVDINQCFLKNLCDDSLYHKFGFEQFFKQNTGTISRIHIDTEELHGKVTFDCLKIISGEAGDAADAIDNLIHNAKINTMSKHHYYDYQSHEQETNSRSLDA